MPRPSTPTSRSSCNYITQPPDFTGFNDPAKGKEIAAAQYEAGADVIYSAAGGSGLGAFEAAAEAGEPGEVWAIGVDSDQYDLVTRRPAAVHPHLDAEEGRRGRRTTPSRRSATASSTAGVQVFDLAVDGVGYSTTGGFVDDIADQLDEFKEQIVSGEIEVPTAP